MTVLFVADVCVVDGVVDLMWPGYCCRWRPSGPRTFVAGKLQCRQQLLIEPPVADASLWLGFAGDSWQAEVPQMPHCRRSVQVQRSSVQVRERALCVLMRTTDATFLPSL